MNLQQPVLVCMVCGAVFDSIMVECDNCGSDSLVAWSLADEAACELADLPEVK